MVSWGIWLVRSAAAWFMILLAVVLLIFLISAKDKAFIGCMAAVFGMAGLFSLPRMPNAWKRDPPTQKQIIYAERLGIEVTPGITKGELSDMISRVTGK